MYTKKQLETALLRHEIIAPLLEECIEPAQRQERRAKVMKQYGISERSLRRYVAAYRKEGYAGLTRKERSDAGCGRVITPEVLSAAITLKEELPQRSIRAIKKILENEGVVAQGKIKRSTLDEHLRKSGHSKADMKYRTASSTPRRFVRHGRNTLWQSDLKYGPYIPDKSGKMKRTYLVAFIDDATRLVTHAQFYDNQRLPILEHCFKRAVLKYGKPDSVYVDNGKIFVSNWFRLACMKLGIRHMRAKPYSAQSKGKIERFNGFVESFLAELSLAPASTLDELNQKWKVWLDDEYIHKLHSRLDGKTPMEAYMQDAKPVKMAHVEDLYDAFIHEATCRVDKTGCLKLGGTEYEAGTAYVGEKVTVYYDPFDPSEIHLDRGKGQKIPLKPHVPKEFCGSATVPDPVAKPGHSRMFGACQTNYDKRQKNSMGAIAFRQLGGKKRV